MKLDGDSFRVPDEIFLEHVPETPLRVLLFLLHESLTGGECNPGFAAISRHTGVSENAARAALRWLKKKGWISRMQRAGPYKNQFIYLQIPHRLRPAKPANVITAKEDQFKVL